MANNTSQHILNTSANLLGFCLFVVTSMHITNYAANSMIDEFTSAVSLLLILSCLFSFFSIKTLNAKKEKQLENVADYLFAIALSGIFIIVIFMTFGWLK
ncbi:MAG: hypothetical protein JST96_11155 [Bacteroidetes bacterium]|nr:hypothetical protein [Bacteroidota bacterium]